MHEHQSCSVDAPISSWFEPAPLIPCIFLGNLQLFLVLLLHLFCHKLQIFRRTIILINRLRYTKIRTGLFVYFQSLMTFLGWIRNQWQRASIWLFLGRKWHLHSNFCPHFIRCLHFSIIYIVLGTMGGDTGTLLLLWRHRTLSVNGRIQIPLFQFSWHFREVTRHKASSARYYERVCKFLK